MTSLAILARRASLVVIRQPSAAVICSTSCKALASQVARFHKTRMFATLYDRTNDDVDHNDFEGHRFREELEEMYRTTDLIQESLDQLKEARAKHLKIVEAGGMPNANMNTLLKLAGDREAVLSNQLAILRENMTDARRRLFAVDAPDGTPDFELSKNQSEVKQIIDFAAEHEDVEKVLADHQKDRDDRARARRTMAVDSPDGMSDDERKIEMESVDSIVDYAAKHEDKAQVLQRHKAEAEEHAQDLKTLAVDAPDGTSDDEVKVEMEAVENFINVAAESKDAGKVLHRHMKEAEEHARNLKTLAVDAPDGISDDEVMIDLEAVDNIIDYASQYEDTAKVNKLHQEDEDARAESLKTLAVDAPDGMSDDEFKIDLEAVQNIVDFAAEHEDADAIVLKHQRERQEHIARMNRVRDENYW